MADPLAGMTREQAEAVCAKAETWTAAVGIENWAAFCALARLGASVVGATEAVGLVRDAGPLTSGHLGDLWTAYEPEPWMRGAWHTRRVLILPVEEA